MRRASWRSAVGLCFGGITACSHATDAPASNGAKLPEPVLPALYYPYADADVPFPPQYLLNGPNFLSVVATDNTPASNPITDAGATLGRVLFYDVRLSANDRVSCGSCHQQAVAFADTARFSRGFKGGITRRHAMSLVNVRFHHPSEFFGDGRASSLEEAVLLSIQDTIQMGSSIDAVLAKLAATRFYPPLFNSAFGTPQMTSERLAKALAQFVRSIVSFQSKFDQAFPSAGGLPNFAAAFTPEELMGQQLFEGAAHCAGCHRTYAQISEGRTNNGLDVIPADTDAGCGGFKVASLRNIAVRGPYMHDGRFATLDQVIEHYDSGVQNGRCLDRRLIDDLGVGVRRLNLTQTQRDALVAFLRTFTDTALLTAPKFSNPFPPQ